MTIDQFLINCVNVYITEFKYLLEKNDIEYSKYWAEKKLNSYIYERLSGNRNKKIRQQIAEKITGQKTPFYKSGIHEIQNLIFVNKIYTQQIF